MNEKKKLSRSQALAAKLTYATLKIIRDNGKEMPIRELIKKVEQTVALDEWAKARFEKTGNLRWQSILHFYSIDCIKAGYLIKKSGIWYITPDGEAALKKEPEELLNSAIQAYRAWKANQLKEGGGEGPDEPGPEEEKISFDDIEQIAMEGLEKYINAKNPYEFQELVAALLRGMGYYTPFIAPRGKDGGIDVMAYRDPLGTESPRIQVQVKHRESAASVQEIRQLQGLLRKEGDVGIFVSSGGFSTDAKTSARSSQVHVELIDLPRFISLWQEFYYKLTDVDKSLLPLIPVYFLDKKE